MPPLTPAANHESGNAMWLYVVTRYPRVATVRCVHIRALWYRERMERNTVRATSILCLLGFGLGLGSVLIYRFCARFFSPAIGATCRRKRALSPSSDEKPHTKQSKSGMPPETSADTSGSYSPNAHMGNARSTHKRATRGLIAASLTAAYTPRDGVSFRGIRRKYSLDSPASLAKQSCRRPVAPPRGSLDDSDCGFVSGSLSEWPSSGYDAEFDGASLAPNFSPDSLNERSRSVMRAMAGGAAGGEFAHLAAFAHSTPDDADAVSSHRTRTRSVVEADDDFLLNDGVSLRRQPFSVPADLDASVLTEEALQDCLGAEDRSGAFLRPEGAGIGGRTVSEMELIQSELRQLRHEIDTMNDEVRHLNTDEQVILPPPISPPPLSPTPLLDVPPPLRAVKRRRHHSRASSSTAGSVHDDHEAAPPCRWSCHHPLEFMWDYQSDLGTVASPGGGDFVTSRPVAIPGDGGGDGGGTFYVGSPDPSWPPSPTYSHVRSFFERSHSLTDSLGGGDPRAPPGATLSDLYIDDDIDHILAHCGGGVTSAAAYDNVTNNNVRNALVDFRSSSSSPLNVVPPVCRKTAVISPCQNVADTPTGGAPNGAPAQHIDDWRVENLTPRCNVYEYAEREWRGSSERAQTVKRAYHRIPALFGLSNLRRVRADNYCALRAVLYQLMVNNLAAQNKNLATRQQVLQRLDIFNERQYGYLQGWHFANRLPFSRERVVERIGECVRCFYQQLETLSQLSSYASRERHLQQLLNGRPAVDVQLLEAVKLLMQLTAISLHEDAACGNAVPVFAWLLFARDTSTTPEALFTNHINHIGDTTTLQQIEMYLLGHALGVKIEVARPARLGHDDFISHYPDDGADLFPKVYLIAEDDRHYNVVVP